MRLKLSLLAVLMLTVSMLSAQSFFKPVPRLKVTPIIYRSVNPFGAPNEFKPYVGTKDSTMNAFRPIANLAAYAEPGHILMAGAGFGLQHLKFDVSTQKWYCEWSVSAMGWAGGSVAPATPAQIVSYGVMVGLFNNMVMVGPAINSGKLQAVISLGISFNN